MRQRWLLPQEWILARTAVLFTIRNLILKLLPYAVESKIYSRVQTLNEKGLPSNGTQMAIILDIESPT